MGEIVVGCVFGPHVADVVPQADALMLYGEVGLMLLVLEAGLDVDVSMLRLIGLRGVGVAVTGSLMPLCIAATLSVAVLGLDYRAALALGCTLAPTSMGIALHVLKRGKVLNTPTGQLIIAAAVLDDVIALVLLSTLQALDDPTAAALLRPVLTSLGLMLAAGALAVWVMPRLMAALKPRLPPKRRDKALLGLLFGAFGGLVPACHALGSSHLLGAFLAGVCFCTDASVHAAWTRQVKRLLQWLLRVFFSCTIAFEIPVEHFCCGGEALHVWRGALPLLAGAGKSTGL